MENNINQYKNYTPNTTVNDIIGFISLKLPSFKYSFSGNNNKINEKLINSALLDYFMEIIMTNNLKFYFVPDRPNTVNASNVDFSIIGAKSKTKETFFTIEAKRLPARKGYKKEYVSGNLGGIERFKRNKHGIDKNGKLLPLNAMIAYVEKHDFNYWLNQINEWIIEQTNTSTDLKWTKNEILEKISFDNIAILKSNHLRINNEHIMLNHFWICLQH